MNSFIALVGLRSVAVRLLAILTTILLPTVVFGGARTVNTGILAAGSVARTTSSAVYSHASGWFGFEDVDWTTDNRVWRNWNAFSVPNLGGRVAVGWVNFRFTTLDPEGNYQRNNGMSWYGLWQVSSSPDSIGTAADYVHYSDWSLSTDASKWNKISGADAQNSLLWTTSSSSPGSGEIVPSGLTPQMAKLIYLNQGNTVTLGVKENNPEQKSDGLANDNSRMTFAASASSGSGLQIVYAVRPTAVSPNDGATFTAGTTIRLSWSDEISGATAGRLNYRLLVGHPSVVPPGPVPTGYFVSDNYMDIYIPESGPYGQWRWEVQARSVLSDSSSTLSGYVYATTEYTPARYFTVLPPSTRIVRLDGDLAFGNVQVGSSAQRTLRIWNDGNAALNVSGISYPSGFSGSWSGSIGAGSYRDVTVTFSPSSAASYGGNLTVSSDATGGTNTKGISGTGTSTPVYTRVIRLDGDLAFGSVQVGSSAQRTLRIYNDGNSTLNVSGIGYPSGFNGAWSGTISAGSYRDVTVTFSPSSATTYSGNLTVNSDATSGTNARAVSGTGTPQGGATHGLLGQYYNDMDFSDLAFERVDSTVDFNWLDGAPSPIMPSDGFSIRWIGYITPPASGTYNFYVTSDDGSILYVGGTEVVYNWGDHGPEEASGSVTLQAGQNYEIQLVYYENTGGATVSLMWDGPGISKQVIPAQYLTPEAGSTTPSTPYKGVAAVIPGRVEMEKFDEGGQDIAYVDIFGTLNGGKYRPGELVDLKSAIGAKNGWYVRDTVAGEWMQYTVNATKTAVYTLSVRYKAGLAGGGLHVELDGVDITGPLTLKATSGYWKNMTVSGIPITAGEHKIRVVMDRNASNGIVAFFDCMTFSVPK